MDAPVNHLVGIGVYSPVEAANLTGASVGSIRRWLRGYKFGRGSEARASAPVWTPDIDDLQGRLALSFLDMMEVRFVRAFREHKVSWPAIREAVVIAREMFGDRHPFTRGRFRTDGARIFHQVEEAGTVKLFDVNRRSWVFNDIVAPSLFKDVELDGDQVARWFPAYPSREIVIDPRIAFGRPILTKEGVPTDVIAASIAAQNGEVAPVARWYKITLQAARAAFEFENGRMARAAP